MTRIDNIDYSAWTNQKAVKIAKKVDKDGIAGLSLQEAFNFVQKAYAQNIDKSEIYELIGLSVSNNAKTRRAENPAPSRERNTDFDKAVNYYNQNMDWTQRNSVTNQTFTNLETRLYNMEKSIDQAFIDCDAYKDIVIVPRWHYRFYPYLDTRLINFDIEELRNTTAKDMNALHQLKDKVESIIEEANGINEHTEPQKTEYDIDALAQKHLGMSYEEFEEKYHDELEFCKTATMADLGQMTPTQAMVYSKAKAYAKEMLNITINEAHNVNWDAGKRKTEETLKATGDMYTVMEFEDDNITEEGLNKIQSGIMYKAFEEALISKHREFDPTGVEGVKVNNLPQKPRKVIVNGTLLIFHPNGSVYNGLGERVK